MVIAINLGEVLYLLAALFTIIAGASAFWRFLKRNWQNRD